MSGLTLTPCPVCGESRGVLNVAELYRRQLADSSADDPDPATDAALEDIFPLGLPPRPARGPAIDLSFDGGDVAWVVAAGLAWGASVALGLVIAIYVPEFGFAPLGFGIFLGLLVFGLLCYRAQRGEPDWPPAAWREAYYCPRDRIIYFAGDSRPYPPGHLTAQLEA
ncbi:MAG TPA: hypothetical protein VHL09_05870 [Dehalococcoidia bacterium]|nr:hypothetical protein [Dehalococcoidia bacterium]